MQTNARLNLYLLLSIIPAIRKGNVTPSLIENILNKGKQDPQTGKTGPLFKRLLANKRNRRMNEKEILAKLSTEEGKSEILDEIGKGKLTEN